MPRSGSLVLVVMGAVMAACAAKAPPQPPPQQAPGRPTGGILALAANIPVVAGTEMPPGFEPIPLRPPLWMRGGREVVVAGTLHGVAMVVDFQPGSKQPRVLVADRGPGVPDAILIDYTPSPDRSSIAFAMARGQGNRLEVFRYDLANDQLKLLDSIEGKFESASLGWPTAGTIAMAVNTPPPPAPAPESSATGPSATPAAESAAPTPSPTPAPRANDGPSFTLYLVAADGSAGPEPIQLNCALSPLNWSPDGAYAVGEGGDAAAPMLLDRQKKTCARLNIGKRIRVLDWAPGAGAFIYAGATVGSPLASVFQFDIPTLQTAPVAVSSSAAAYVSATAMLALGNRELTPRRALQNPRTLVDAELALIDPGHASVKVATLGVPTLPEMMASSSMTYAARSETAAIELFAPGGTATLRHIIAYSTKTEHEVLIASGQATGLALMAWSPDGKTLAMLDGDSAHTALTLVRAEAIAQAAAPSISAPLLGPAAPLSPGIH